MQMPLLTFSKKSNEKNQKCMKETVKESSVSESFWPKQHKSL
jgi:hypothetical protein